MRVPAMVLSIALMPGAVSGEELPRHGWLVVKSEPPGCRVLVGDKEIGKTPIERHELLPGRYQVRVKHRCYHQYFKQVVIGRNEPAEVTATMRPRMGTIQLSALDENDRELNAGVFIDGKMSGVTPCKLEVPVCERKVVIRSKTRGNFADTVFVKERTVVHASVGKTWRDPKTGLIWQKRPQSKIFHWREGEEYCSGLILSGKTDWRLPSLPELQSILRPCELKHGWRYCPENKGPSKHGCYWPTELDGTCPSGTGAAYYWSSRHDRRSASYIKFSSGVQASFTLGSRRSVRCVRGEMKK